MATTVGKRKSDTADQRERIDSYLQRSGLASRNPRVVPLTGDASDRRYFRVCCPTSRRSCSPFTPARSISTRAVRECRAAVGADAGAGSRVLGHADDLGVMALEDLG